MGLLKRATDLFMGNKNPLGKDVNSGQKTKTVKNTQDHKMTTQQIEKACEEMKNNIISSLNKNLSPEQREYQIKAIEINISIVKNDFLYNYGHITPQVYKQNKELLEKESKDIQTLLKDGANQKYLQEMLKIQQELDRQIAENERQINQFEPKPQTQAQVSEGVKNNVSQILENPEASNAKNTINIDVLDLSRVIDINAESRAIEAYDEMIRNSKEGNFFKKAGGFLKRSFYRMGREAWIESKKRLFIKEIREGLKTGDYTEDVLRAHSIEANRGIEEKAYLSHEEIKKDSENIPAPIKLVINEWLNAPLGSPIRDEKIKELKTLLENEYHITTDLNQLETSLIRVEKNKIPGDLGAIEAKLNLFDIGRTRDGYGDKMNGNNRKSFVVNMFGNIDKSSLPKWLKGALQHPNLSAVLSALGTRSLLSVVAGGAALGFSGGLLVPVLVGSGVGGLLAYGRSKREIKDRNAQIDRRGANGDGTGIKNTDGESVDNLSKPLSYQHSTKDLYDRVNRVGENREDALVAGIYYLVKHLVGSQTDLNMLKYEEKNSVSKQHVDMIILLNKVFPGLVSRFNSGDLFDETKTDNQAQLTRRLYSEILNLAQTTISNRDKLEKSYAKKQGAIYAGIGAGVGLGIGTLLHEFGVGSTPDTKAPDITNQITGPQITTTSYPDNLTAYSVKRPEWFDLKTPAPKIEGTELMIHTDSGGWNVSNILGKTPFNNNTTLPPITGSDFTSGKIQAVITPSNGGPSFTLPIDSTGNIQIPNSLKDIFAQKSFKYLEVGIVEDNSGDIILRPIATVPGSGSATFDMITTITPGKDEIEIIPGETIPGTTPWYGVPFGGNKYHNLGVIPPKDKNNEDPKDPKSGAGEIGLPIPPKEPKSGAGEIELPIPPKDPKSGDLVVEEQTPFPIKTDGELIDEKTDNFTTKIVDLEPRDFDLEKLNESLNTISDKDFVIIGTKVEGEYIKFTRNGYKFDLEFFENGNFIKKETVDSINIGYPDINSGYKFAETYYNGIHYGNIKEIIFNYHNSNFKQDLEKTDFKIKNSNEYINIDNSGKGDFKELLEKAKGGDKLEIGDYVYRRVNNGWQKFDKDTSLATKDYVEGIFMKQEDVLLDFENFNKIDKSQKEPKNMSEVDSSDSSDKSITTTNIDPKEAIKDSVTLYAQVFRDSKNAIIGREPEEKSIPEVNLEIQIPESVINDAESIAEKAKQDAYNLFISSFINFNPLKNINSFTQKIIDLEIQDVYIEKLNESLNLINEDQIVILGTKVEGNHIQITRNGDKFKLQQFVDGKSIGQSQSVEYLNILYPIYTSSGYKFAETNYNGNHYGNIKEVIIYTKVKKSKDEDNKSTVSLENFKKSLENSKIGDKVEIGDYIYKKVNNGWKQFNKGDNLITADYIKLVKENDLINNFFSIK